MDIRWVMLKKKGVHRLSKVFPALSADEVILDFLRKSYGSIAQEYREKKWQPVPPTHDTIWTFWAQGYDAAPPLVRRCIDSMRKNANGRDVKVLTLANLKEYVDIPSYIWEKVQEGAISLTHLSDILRMELLATHGGLWLDATMFVARPIPDVWFTHPYYTIHYTTSNSTISKGRWTIYCQSSFQGSLIYSFCRDVFAAYLKQYDRLGDYFLFDYVMAFGYEQIPAFRNLVDAVPLNNEGVKDLDRHFSDRYKEIEVQSLLGSSTFFKLNWKRTYQKEQDGEPTVYGRFLEGELVP